MPDIVDQETRSRMMAGIRGKDTRPELVLRHALHARGFRYRLHVRNLPGKPDLVLRKFRAVIFVHGCFWHRHEGCRYATMPTSHIDFWQTKFAANINRDRSVEASLRLAGWRVAIVWECALKKTTQLETTANLLDTWLHGETAEITIGEADLQA